jgi:predicted metal-dependent phosphoesterase TrpH
MDAAHTRGLSAIALTDHDTVDGIAAAGSRAAELGMKFIAGREFGIEWNRNGEFHLLGLRLGEIKPSLLGVIEDVREKRIARNKEIVRLMQADGVDISYEQLVETAGDTSSVGRPHFAAFLIKQKMARNNEQAFNRYLVPGAKFYVPKSGAVFDKAAAAIHESGGIAVLAHPASLYLSFGGLEELLGKLKGYGLDGIEAYHPITTELMCKRFEILGRSFGLKITAGSDFHGENRPDRQLGLTTGGIEIDDRFLEEVCES